MAKQYSEEAVVRIWRNVKKLGKVPTSHFGHAAITVRGSRVNPEKYISFWPGEGAGIGSSAIRDQPGFRTDSYADDKVGEMSLLTSLRLEVGYRQKHRMDYPAEWDQALRANNTTSLSQPRPGQRRLTDAIWGTVIHNGDGYPLWSQSAESKVNLPGLGANGRVWGLSTRRMGIWFDDFMRSKPRYQALSKRNCAGIALWALQAGGSEAFAKLPSVTIYAEPRQVENYANTLLTQIDRMDQWSRDIDADFRTLVMGGKVKDGAAPQPGDTNDGLWTLKAWKKQTDLGRLSKRSNTIKEIDAGIEAFHRANWDDKFPKRFEAMTKIFLNVVKHRQDKSDSKRSVALLFLANQVLAHVRSNAGTGVGCW